MRLAEYQGAIYLDLANDHWQAIEVTSSGWQLIFTPPVKFRRARGMLPLSVPETGGSLADVLRPFVNLASDADWRLLVSWLVATLRHTGPYPILVIHGEQGSAKSTLVRVLQGFGRPQHRRPPHDTTRRTGSYSKTRRYTSAGRNGRVGRKFTYLFSLRGCLETKPLSEKILGHMRGKAKNGLTE
jgi:hypothetical protein